MSEEGEEVKRREREDKAETQSCSGEGKKKDANLVGAGERLSFLDREKSEKMK